MAGKETIGFLTESSLLPKKAKPITNVGDSSLLHLKSLVFNTQQALARRGAQEGPSPLTSLGGSSAVSGTARRKGTLPMPSNRGVEARNAADLVAEREARKKAEVSLAQKTIVYEILSGSLSGPRALEALQAVDVSTLPSTVRRQLEKTLGMSIPVRGRDNRAGIGADHAAEAEGDDAEILVDMYEKRDGADSHSTGLTDAELIALAKKATTVTSSTSIGDTGVRAAWERLMTAHDKDYLKEIQAEVAAARQQQQSSEAAEGQVADLLSAAVAGVPAAERVSDPQPTPLQQFAAALRLHPHVQEDPEAQRDERRRRTERRVAMMMEGRVAEVLADLCPSPPAAGPIAKGTYSPNPTVNATPPEEDIEEVEGPKKPLTLEEMESAGNFHAVAPPSSGTKRKRKHHESQEEEAAGAEQSCPQFFSSPGYPWPPYQLPYLPGAPWPWAGYPPPPYPGYYSQAWWPQMPANPPPWQAPPQT